nr:alpha/beta hydrolase-fold protein [Dermatophilus congolensis]
MLRLSGSRCQRPGTSRASRSALILRAGVAFALVAALAGCGGDDSSPANQGNKTASKPTPTEVKPLASWSKQPVKVGRAVETKYQGPKSGVSFKVHVWLPTDYDEPSAASKRYPVVVAFPGGSGTTGTPWFTHGGPSAIAAGAQSGKSSQFILVQPQMQIDDAHDTECTDLEGQPQVGTFLGKDLPELIKHDFRTSTSSTGWGTTGVSSGGYCAAVIAMHNPNTFSAAAPLDGYFNIDSNLAAGKTPAAKATDPMHVVQTAPPKVAIKSWYGTGANNGALSKKNSTDFAAVVKPPTTFEMQEVPNGAHSWTTYTSILPDVFSWLSSKLDKPAG